MAKTMYSWDRKHTNYTYHNILLINLLHKFMYSQALFPKTFEKSMKHFTLIPFSPYLKAKKLGNLLYTTKF